MKKKTRERKKVEARLKRLGQIYLDDLISDDEYRRHARRENNSKNNGDDDCESCLP